MNQNTLPPKKPILINY